MGGHRQAGSTDMWAQNVMARMLEPPLLLTATHLFCNNDLSGVVGIHAGLLALGISIESHLVADGRLLDARSVGQSENIVHL
jgi:hypothetical protein